MPIESVGFSILVLYHETDSLSVDAVSPGWLVVAPPPMFGRQINSM